MNRRRVGIVGLGQIGGGLADLLADQGVPMLLYVRRPEAAGLFRAGFRRRLERRRDRGQLSDSAVDGLLRGVRVTQDFSGFRDVDLAVEAISEDPTAKRAILAELSRACPSSSILASTTSELPLAALGAGLPAATRIVGAHFLSPVRLTMVVEIIPTGQSAPWVVTEMADWCRALGKRPFVFRRSVVNRLLAGYIAEGLSLCATYGIAPEDLDARTVDAGFLMGPLSMLDLVGLDLALDVFSLPTSALVSSDARSLRILGTLRAEGHLGRKTKSGIFLYAEKGRGTNPRFRALLREFREGPGAGGGEGIVERIWLRLIDEYLCCVAQGLGERDEIDAVLREVLGTAEGPIERIRNLDPTSLQARLTGLEVGLGDRFEPTHALLERVTRYDG